MIQRNGGNLVVLQTTKMSDAEVLIWQLELAIHKQSMVFTNDFYLKRIL